MAKNVVRRKVMVYLATGGLPTMEIIYFSAPWCAPCKQLGPIFDAVLKEYPTIKVRKIDVDTSRELQLFYKVMSVPTLVFTNNGPEVFRKTGGMNALQLRVAIKVAFDI